MTREELARKLRNILRMAAHDSYSYERALEALQPLPLNTDQYALAIQIVDAVLNGDVTPEKGAAQILRAGAPAST